MLTTMPKHLSVAGAMEAVAWMQVCSDRNKPDGQCLIPREVPAILAFVDELPIRKVCGIGKVPLRLQIAS